MKSKYILIPSNTSLQIFKLKQKNDQIFKQTLHLLTSSVDPLALFSAECTVACISYWACRSPHTTYLSRNVASTTPESILRSVLLALSTTEIFSIKSINFQSLLCAHLIFGGDQKIVLFQNLAQIVRQFYRYTILIC